MFSDNDLLNSEVALLVDLVEKREFFSTLQKEELLKYFIDHYSHIVEEEIFNINIGLIENQINSKNDSLLLSRNLFEIRRNLKDDFKNFLKECSLEENDSEFVNESLKNDSQEKSILGIMRQIIKNQSFGILKEYRESPQARKDIKKNINNQNISSSILNPFLMLLNDTNAPSLRMELWQKFEMYFESGWGFNDLTTNESNSPLAAKMQDLIKKINENHENLSTHNGLGNELLTILSERISELGVPIQIKMEKNIINGANTPVATILSDKTKYKHSFLSKNTMGSGFVDWAIPNYLDKEILHCSLATSDETCSIENSEAFRYEYALRNLCNNKNIFKKIELSFYSTSTFYDEYDADIAYSDGKNKEIGRDFLKRYSVNREQRELLNIIPFFAMSHKISSNLKTGIYSPDQLMSYNFKILGAKSIIEDKNYDIEEIYKKCISALIKVFSQDKSTDCYSDSKSLNMLNQLYNLLTTSKDEFFDSAKIFDLLTNNETAIDLNNILKKIPDNQNNEKQVNKNDFKTLIQSLKYMKAIGYEAFKEEQIEYRNELLKELDKIKELTDLSTSILHIKNINESIEDIKNKSSSMQEIDDFITLPKNEQKLLIQNLLIEQYSYYSDGRTNYQCVLQQNQTINNYSYDNYPLSAPTYYNHRKKFNKFEETKDLFLYQWKNNNIENSVDNLLKMCYFYVKDINEDNFHEFKFPSVFSHLKTAKKIENYMKLLDPSHIQKIKQEQKNNLDKMENLIIEKNEIISTIKKIFHSNDVDFILNKLDIEEEICKEINNKKPIFV